MSWSKNWRLPPETEIERVRCCSNYQGLHFCKALSRICYVCRNYGHYASSSLCKKQLKLKNNITSSTINGIAICDIKSCDIVNANEYTPPFSEISNKDINDNLQTIPQKDFNRKLQTAKAINNQMHQNLSKHVKEINYLKGELENSKRQFDTLKDSFDKKSEQNMEINK